MKKAVYVLLSLFGLFLALLIGVFIGRSSVSGLIVIPENATNLQQGAVHYDEEIVDDPVLPSKSNSGKININTASVSLLQTLPNIGEVLAQRIVDYRNENGNYTAPEDLLLVEGIGEKRLEQIREYITVGG